MKVDKAKGMMGQGGCLRSCLCTSRVESGDGLEWTLGRALGCRGLEYPWWRGQFQIQAG